jgi:hypothetical protein
MFNPPLQLPHASIGVWTMMLITSIIVIMIWKVGAPDFALAPPYPLCVATLILKIRDWM